MMPEKSFDRAVLFGLIVLQVLLFSSFYLREVAWYPPDNFDQASYLIETYQLQERIFTHGLGQIWKYLWSRDHAAGVFFPIEGALAGIIFGRLWAACAVAAFALGLYNQLDQARRHRPDFSHREDLKRLDELDKAMVDLASEMAGLFPELLKQSDFAVFIPARRK